MGRAVVFFLLALAAPAAAQTSDDPLLAEEELVGLGGRPRLYAGAGVSPGIGGVVLGSDPVVGFFTREVVLYADYVPRIVGGPGRLLVAVGLGGSVRALRVYSVATNRDFSRYDLDLGVRLGPSFYTAFFEQTAASEARAFSVMLDPFARATTRVGSGRVVFAEVGAQAPAFRAGFSTAIRR